jgi:hypothetical protein
MKQYDYFTVTFDQFFESLTTISLFKSMKRSVACSVESFINSDGGGPRYVRFWQFLMPKSNQYLVSVAFPSTI